MKLGCFLFFGGMIGQGVVDAAERHRSVSADLGFERCMSIYGCETQSKAPVCSWVRGPDYYIPELKRLGFDSLRLPFSGQYVREGDFSQLDNMVGLAQQNEMSVLLDYHRTFNDHQGATPEEGSYSLQDFINVWETVLDRYQQIEVVRGVGVYNEYQGGDAVYWNKVLKQVISTLDARYPERFTYFAGGTNWGNDISQIDLSSEPYWNRTVLEVHKYSFTSSSLEANWDATFSPYTDKVFVGEFGWKQEDPAQVAWATKFIDYLKRKNITSTCAWTVALSSDTNGWWKDDCVTFDDQKMALLKTLWDKKEVVKVEAKKDPMQFTLEEAIDAIVRLRGSVCQK